MEGSYHRWLAERNHYIGAIGCMRNFMSKRSLYEDVNLPEAVHLSGEYYI